MPSKLHTAIQEVISRRKNTSGNGSTYNRGWNAAMAEVQKVLDTYRDDGNGETRVRYEWGIQQENGNVHRVSVARGIVERELVEQLTSEEDSHGKPTSKLVCREVVAQLHGDWVEPTEAGVP
jgi:hypothetical protein